MSDHPEVSRARDTLVGRALGEFVLRERIGQGGFGAVYRATQPALDREAVVKVMHANLRVSKAATERFLREAKLASKLDHPYAAHIYAFGVEPDGEAWIAMELVRGTPLDQILKLQGPLTLERFVPLFDRICEVVHTAHEQGIIHRDLKPANVMVLARAGRLLPKLLDLGIAKGLGDSPVSVDDAVDLAALAVGAISTELSDTIEATPPVSDHGLTQRGAMMGSPHYMAPEQWLDAARVDARTDLYALAILACECLTGKPPFAADTLTKLALQHARAPVPPLGERFPSALDGVLAKALAKQPADRYGNALELAAAFREASGVASDATSLPGLEPAMLEASIHDAPQPIAEAVGALHAARNAYQARDALAQVARTITRYLGILALACRSRVVRGADSTAVAERIRTLYRRGLADAEWLALARDLTAAWLDRREAYPIPELIDALHVDAVDLTLAELATLREREVASEKALQDHLASAIDKLGRVLHATAFVRDYPLVFVHAAGVGERWMGARRQRATVPLAGKNVAIGAVVLLDSDGAPVLSLAPLVQVAAPTPGAPNELFLFEGRDARGAKLVVMPSGLERHDDAVWDWFRSQLAGTLDDSASTTGEQAAPYRGLRTFSTEDSAQFFGREKLVDAFMNRLKSQALLAVVGRSGAGKSSFVHAGVIPALPEGWRALTFRPGTSPLRALAARLEHAGFSTIDRGELVANADALGELLRADAVRRGPVLVVVDQLEEVFTLCDDAGERQAFVAALATAARAADDPVRVVFTLRDDFLVRAEQIPALRNRIGHGLQLLTVPAAEDLLRILVEPARRAGYELEGELAQAMVDEVADQPGALPLISFTAERLWELRDRHFRQLTRAAYRTLGGVGGALAHHADLTLDGFPPEERALAREAFRQLVTSQNTRAVLARKDLRQLLGGDEHADRVIEQLVAARLLVASENAAGLETIEIVHEALITAWPRLVEWLREDAEGARFREQLRAAAEQWHERGRAKGLLWRGDALADFVRWRARHGGPLTEVEDAFGAASLAEAARGRRNLRLLVASAFAVLVVVVVGLVVFNTRIARQRGELRSTLERQYEDVGRRLLVGGDPQQALAYLARAGSLGAYGRAHDFLVAQALQAVRGELFEVRHDGPVRSVAFARDGARFVTASFDGTARIWDARNGAPVATLPHGAPVVAASFSHDDRSVLTASSDGTVALWNAADGASLHRMTHAGGVACAALSPRGDLAASGGPDGLVIWDLARGAERTRLPMHDARACAFSHDGALVAVGDGAGTTRLVEVDSGRVRHELSGQKDVIYGLAFAPDDGRLVTASYDNTAAVWDTASGAQQHVLAHAGLVNSAEFSPDGRRVLTGSSDSTAVVWDAETGAKLTKLVGHTGGIVRASFSPDGTRIVTTSEDTTAWLWEAASGLPLARWRDHRDAVYDVAFDPLGQRVVTAGDDGRAIAFEVAAQEHVVPIAGHPGGTWMIQFSPDGTKLVTAGRDGLAGLWDATTGHELAMLRGHRGGVVSASFSPDGRWIATSGDDSTVRIWSVDSALQQRELTAGGAAMRPVAWAPDSRSVLAPSRDGTLYCWDIASGRPRFVHAATHGAFVRWAAFDPSGTRILGVTSDQLVRVWDLDGTVLGERHDSDAPYSVAYDRTGTRVLSMISGRGAKVWNAASGATEVELVGHDGFLAWASWSADAALIVTTSQDGTARVWDAATGDALAVVAHPGWIMAAGFSPDGHRLALAYQDGSAAIVDLPRNAPSQAELEALVRARVPYDVEEERIRRRARDRR